MKNKIFFGVILSVSLLYCLYIFYMYPLTKDVTLENLDKEIAIPETCILPILNPFDKSILKFIQKPDNLTCSPNEPLIDSDLNYLYINEHLLPVYGVKNIKKINCCYRAFQREIPKTRRSDNGIVYSNDCIPFSSKIKINDEFVEVNCEYRDEQIYYDMFHFVPIKANRNREKESIKSSINVVILGIDSLSQMNFQRQMPKTKKYIEENLYSIPMFGYNKIDDNSFPNLLPILTGHSMREITKICWQNKYEKFDNCHFIWNDYSDAGYLTAFAEDASYMGLFHLDKQGFQMQPTDYYWRTFNYHAEKKMGKRYCLGPRPIHKVLLNYAKKFTLTLKDEPFFGFFWSTTLSHDCLNCPSLTDEDYVEFFDDLKRENVLNNTVVIFLSDQGFRDGDILGTYQGYLEERLPLLYFIFPPWFQELYPLAITNMLNNSYRLTSNFDVHETLMDLVNVEELKTKCVLYNYDSFMEKRGISLFSHVPESRTCEMAGIPYHWCMCKKRSRINVKNYIVKKIAKFIVSHINNLLKFDKNCATLVVDTIKAAIITKAKLRDNKIIKEYTITLETKPGAALFESTVQCTGSCKKKDLYEISGISRLNRYGNQSSCISDYLLRMYCYCI